MASLENPSTSDHPISTKMVQVVNYEEQFNKSISTFFKDQKISQRGFDYNVASIMGPQSSGKSTLLNMLFGTQFRTMDEASGRYQVTQGVWMGRDSQSGIVVMDLEGTDSRERGEDSTTFERKSALFALALSEVLIVNVWAQDVGRYNAANLALLKTIMELDLQLFFGGSTSAVSSPEAYADSEFANNPPSPKERMHKTRLLFVLRDHVSSPFETLCSTLQADVDTIWNTISKPEAAVGTPITDYFDLDFFALPHKVLMAKQFQEKGAELCRRFQEGEIFQEEYRRGVAADGFAQYAEAVWETIRANKELDIPSQKEMLAHVRCEQIAKEALAGVEEVFAPLRKKLLPSDGSSAEIVPNLFMTLLSQCNKALDSYNAAAFRYSKTVADMKGSDLRTRIKNESKALFSAQVSLASDISIREFRASVVGSGDTSKLSSPWMNWGEVIQTGVETAIISFDGACSTEGFDFSGTDEEGHPLEFSILTASNAKKRLSESLDIELERATADVMTSAQSQCVKTFRNAFKAPLSTVLESPSEDVWDRTSEVSSAAWEATSGEARNVYGDKGLGFDDKRLEETIEDFIKPVCYETALVDIKDAIGTPANFLLRMTKRFDDVFRFDERGVPRHFGPNEDIETLFVAAREKGEELVELLGEVKLKGPLTKLRDTARSIDPEVLRSVILETHSKTDLLEKLKRQAGAVFMEAKRAQEAAKITTKIPFWVFVLVLILGWNEILAVLRSPLLLLLTVLVVPMIYVGYMLDGPTLLGPAVKAALSPLLEQAKDLLEQATAPGPVQPPVTDAPSSSELETESAASTHVSSNSRHSD